MSISWAKLPIRHKCIVVAGSLLLICWLYYFYIIEAQGQKIDSLTTRLQDENKKLAMIQEFVRTHPEPDVYLIGLRKKSVQINTMLPGQSDLGSLVTQVEQAAKASGLLLIEVKPLSPLIKAGYREIPVEIRLTGPFSQTKDFLRKLENIPRFTSVDHVAISSRQGVLDSKLVLVVYSYGEQAEPAADKEGLPGQTSKK